MSPHESHLFALGLAAFIAVLWMFMMAMSFVEQWAWMHRRRSPTTGIDYSDPVVFEARRHNNNPLLDLLTDRSRDD